MAKSNQSNRGGARKGAGRKPKDFVSQSRKPEVLRAANAAANRISDSSLGPASAIAKDAYAALHDVIKDGTAVAAARVTAARAIIELAKAEQALAGSDANAPTGKKAQAAQAAQNVVTTPNDEWGTDLMLPN